jgi:uncharacterized membrane protein
MEEYFRALATGVALAVNACAALFIAFGAIEAVYSIIRRYTPHTSAAIPRKAIWVSFATWLLLALEFELAADVLETAISPTWNDVGMLASIAGIRTVLNYFLEKDIERYVEPPVERPA